MSEHPRDLLMQMVSGRRPAYREAPASEAPSPVGFCSQSNRPIFEPYSTHMLACQKQTGGKREAE